LPGEPQTRQVQFRDWMPPNSKPHVEKVLVFSNCQKVELFLNGKSLGMQDRPEDDSPRQWTVPYAPGDLRAIGSNNGKSVATDELQTPGKAAKIVLAADWDGVCFVRATITDENGVREPAADDLISFDVAGPGLIAAVENDDRMSHEPFQAKQHKAYGGECVAVIKATDSGKITLNATSPRFAATSLTINAVAEDRP
jgi:beta-galactosidase